MPTTSPRCGASRVAAAAHLKQSREAQGPVRFGFYACARCALPLVSLGAKVRVPCGYATFDRYFGPSLDVAVLLTGTALEALSGVAARIVLRCTQCGLYVGDASRDKDTASGDVLKLRSDAIAYANEVVPEAYVAAERFTTDDDAEASSSSSSVFVRTQKLPASMLPSGACRANGALSDDDSTYDSDDDDDEDFLSSDG